MSIDLKEVLKTGLDALQSLYDEQNGPPIVKWEDQWNEAMEKSESALKLLNRVINEIEYDNESNIILEYLAGKEIEYRQLWQGEYRWFSYHAGCTQPRIGDPTYRWRVKPETIKYRIALCKHENLTWVSCVESKSAEDYYENGENFVRWITDWIEVEV